MSDAVMISMIGGIVSLISLAMTLLIKSGQDKQTKKVDKLHEDVNGKMQQLIEARGEAKMAEGKEAGIAQQRAQGQQTADAVVQTIKDDKDIEITKSKK